MKTILCVDDDGWVLEMLRDSLESRGYRVLVTTNTEVGPACLKFETVDLVLLDLNMPAKDGFQVYRELQSIQPVPVLFVSGCAKTFTERSRDLKLKDNAQFGRFDFIAKPFTLAGLYEKIEGMLNPPIETRKITVPSKAVSATT
jgi:DNA-binding response OmpR family regulator